MKKLDLPELIPRIQFSACLSPKNPRKFEKVSVNESKIEKSPKIIDKIVQIEQKSEENVKEKQIKVFETQIKPKIEPNIENTAFKEPKNQINTQNIPNFQKETQNEIPKIVVSPKTQIKQIYEQQILNKPKLIPPSVQFVQQTTNIQTNGETSPIAEMEALNIPKFLIESYFAANSSPQITKFRDWQINLFKCNAWTTKSNILVHVPTAGGKTIAAEVAIAQILAEDKEAKAIYCVPFVSLASEKHAHFSRRFKEFSVRGYYQSIGGIDFIRGSVAVCTYERADSLINSAMKQGYDDKIKLIIIDEIHMIGDEGRGATIESLVIKSRLMEHKPQIIGLTATLSQNDCTKFKKFMNCSVFDCSGPNAKHTSVQQYIKTCDGYLCKLSNGNVVEESAEKLESLSDDLKHILPIIMHTKESNGNVIYFVNTRKEAELKANFLAKNFPDNDEEEALLNEREEMCRNLISIRSGQYSGNGKLTAEEVFRIHSLIISGVFYHHAGLLLGERRIIEDGFRRGTLNTLVATTTLSAGLDFSAVSLVIIDDVFRNVFNRGETTSVGIQTSQYIQMAGRAGRTTDREGRIVILQNRKTQKELDYIKMLSLQNVEDVETHLLDTEEFDRFLLHIICVFPNANINEISLLTFKGSTISPEQSQELTESSIERLKKSNIIDANGKPTNLGIGIAEANLSIKSGLYVYRNIIRADKSLNLADNLHMMFLCIPEDISTNFPFPMYDQKIWSDIYNKHRDTMERNLGIPGKVFDQMIIRAMLMHTEESDAAKAEEVYDIGDDNFDHIMKKAFCASALLDLTEGASISTIEEKYSLSRGHIETLQNKAVAFCSQVTRICSACGYCLLESALSVFRSSITHCVSKELLPLMCLKTCTREFARKLYNVGIQSPNDILLSSVETIACVLETGALGTDGEISHDSIKAAIEMRQQADKICSKELLLEEMSNI